MSDEAQKPRPSGRGAVTGRELAQARRQLGNRWGLGRDLTLGELGAVLRLKSSNAWGTVESWEAGKREPSGPVTVAIELMLDGADPRHLQEALAAKAFKPGWQDDSTLVVERPGRMRGHSAEVAQADRVLDESGRALKDRRA